MNSSWNEVISMKQYTIEELNALSKDDIVALMLQTQRQNVWGDEL